MQFAWIFLKICRYFFLQGKSEKINMKKNLFKKKTIFRLNFSQVLAYVNFFLDFHFFQSLF